ncbi:MAG: serine/threonine protein kinase [Planctomycetes bacterium]|nr:serine/threonine protein kinase [Planctomycetota bacterium]
MSAIDHAKLRELFDSAMQRPAPERAAFLQEACAGDTLLRDRLEQLIKAAEADGTFLSAPTGELGTTARAHRHSMPLVEAPGTRIGLYKLLQLIGEGGFGSVFLAEQEKPVRRRVALKILKLGMDTKSIIARFEAERQALALMDHPHIARVLDAGATESGRPFFVMEYVVGDAITRFADAHKLDVEARLALFQQVCQAVQHAHTKGIIHRDLKPGNVLVSMSDGKPFAKVIDFGIAKATAQPLTEKTLFTEHRQLLGTPEYMSPEQAEGSADIDTRTDVYALGVLLYELLTGATPFDAKRLRSAAYAELQRIIKEEEPPLPSVRLKRDLTTLAETAAARQIEPAKLNSMVRGELDWIVMKSLDKDRTRRYESASQLAADVQRHLAGEPVVAAPPSTAYRVRKFVKRNRGPVVAAAAVAIALLCGGGVAWWQWRASERLRLEAERTAESLREANERAITNAKGLTKQLWESKYYKGMKPQPGMPMLIGARPDRNIEVTRSSDSESAYTLYALDAEKRRLPATSDDAYLVANYVSATLFADYEAANSELEKSNQSLQRQADAAERSAYTANIALAQAAMQANNWPEARQRLQACPPGKRGWEWDLLSRESAGTLWAKRGDFKKVAMSSDGRQLVALSSDQPPQIWDATSGERLLKLATDDSVNCAAFSPDGRRLATASINGLVDLWNDAGTHLASLRGHTDQVNSVAFDTDGRSLVTASVDGTVRLWDATAGTSRAVMRGSGMPVTCAAISPDGARIVATSTEGTLWIWSASTGELVREIPIGADSLWSLALAPDRPAAAVISQKGELAIWDYESGHKIATAASALSPLCTPQFVRSGELLAVASPSGAVLLLDARDLVDRGMTFPRAAGPLACLAADRGGHAMATVALGEMDSLSGNLLSVLPVEGWGRAMSERFRESGDHDAALSALALLSSAPGPAIEGRSIVSPDGKRRIEVAPDRTVRFLDASTGQEVAIFAVPDAPTRIRMRNDGAILVISLADEDSPELFWDIREPADRLKDRERELAEQPAADAYLQALWMSSRPTEKLEADVRGDDSLTPLRRLVTWRTLRERLADLSRQSSDRYTAAAKLAEERQIKDKLAFARLLDAQLAEAKDLDPRVAELVRAMGEKWEYHEPKPTEAGQLSEAVRRADLLEASGIMQRHLQPSEEDGYMAPSSVELHRAYSLRLQHLGENNDSTFEAEIEMLANDANYLGEPDARAKLDEAILRKEKRTPVPDALLFRAWQFALDSNCDSCNIERAEHYAGKIAEAFRMSVERGLKSIQIHEPVGESAYRMFSADNLPPAEIERIERVLTSHRDEKLRRRCVYRTARNLWHTAAQGVPDWAHDEPTFDLDKVRTQLLVECRQLLSVEPESALGQQTLALILLRFQDLSGARDAIELSIALGSRRPDDPETREIESQPAPVARAIRALILIAIGGDANLAAAREDVTAASAALKTYNGRESSPGLFEPALLITEAEDALHKADAAAP